MLSIFYYRELAYVPWLGRRDGGVPCACKRTIIVLNRGVEVPFRYTFSGL
jgi:hypothetical protein